MKNTPLDIKPILRTLNSIEKKQDLQDQDRELLEDISNQLADFNNRLKIVEDNIKNYRKDLKEDIANVGEAMAGSLDELTTEVANTPKIGISQSIWGRIKLRLTRKEVKKQ